jgi:hypothetical protein
VTSEVAGAATAADSAAAEGARETETGEEAEAALVVIKLIRTYFL